MARCSFINNGGVIGTASSANVKFEFSRAMNHPTATNPGAAEVWEKAPGLYEAKLHWVLGRLPGWVECWFHASTTRVFPWTRVRALDEIGVIGVYRFDQVQEEFSGESRIWHAYGRDALYGVTDNYMRPARADRQTGATSQDDGYTEWPNLTPDPAYPDQELVSRESLERQFGPNDARVADDSPATRLWAFETDAELDTFLATHMAESGFSTEPNKIGPNYEGKGVRRGWVFKDIFRHSAGSFDAASRPVLGVYNRSLSSDDPAEEGEAINSNFSQAQAGGAGANALAYDVAVSWPWKNSATPDSGYDYRTVWPRAADAFAPSGQAVEIARRGDFEWDDDQCLGNDQPAPQIIPDVTQIRITTLGRAFSDPPFCGPGIFTMFTVGPIIPFDHYPTEAEICALAPALPVWACGSTVCSLRTRIDFGISASYTDITDLTALGTCPPCTCCGGVGPPCLSPPTFDYRFRIPSESACLDLSSKIKCGATMEEILNNPNLACHTRTITPESCGTPIGAWEVLIDGLLIYSRVRAMGMGMNNAGGDQTSFLPGAEDTWNPDQNQYQVRREMLVHDYGINEGPELLNLARGYVALPTKKFGGFTTAKLEIWGLPRAGPDAPIPNKLMQAGDRRRVGAGIPNVDPGIWIVDEIEYEFPLSRTTLTLSQRPAAQAIPDVGRSNIRRLGESISGTANTFESEWFHVSDQRFKSRRHISAEPGLFDVFSFRHHLGVMPRNITMIASKTKIFDWWDDAAVEAGQPLYVPEYNLEDYTQVQGVGYRQLNVTEQEIVFSFPRYLFYDARDGRWVPPAERFIKVWISP